MFQWLVFFMRILFDNDGKISHQEVMIISFTVMFWHSLSARVPRCRLSIIVGAILCTIRIFVKLFTFCNKSLLFPSSRGSSVVCLSFMNCYEQSMEPCFCWLGGSHVSHDPNSIRHRKCITNRGKFLKGFLSRQTST